MKKRELTGYPSIDKLHDRDFNFFQRHPIIPNISVVNAIAVINAFNKKDEAVDNLYFSVSYGEMLRDASIMSKAFKELGIKKGDIITVCMNNSYQAISVFLAANEIGAITTYLNYRASYDEIKYYLNTFESPIYFNYSVSEEENRKIKNDTKVKYIVTLTKENLYKKEFNQEFSGMFSYNDFISFADLGLISKYYKFPYNKIQSGKNDALLLYTSGSSGNPKTVVLTNENIMASGIYIKNTINLPQTRNDRCLSFVPFKYPYGFCTSVLLTLLCGRVVVLTPDGLNRENVSRILPNIGYYYGSPALLDTLKMLVPDNLDLSKNHTFVTGGDFFTEKAEKRGLNFFKAHNNENIVFCNGAGNAETVATWSSSVGTKVKPGTVGRILIGTEPIVVSSETLEEKKYGEEGTLLISGKHIFKGYFKDKKLTDKEIVFINGKKYYNTRTIGYLDEERFFSLTGRESRFYILNDGNKVYCEKIQNYLMLIDGVKSAVVVAKLDDETRFSGKAYIVLDNGIMPDENTKNIIFDKMKCEIFDMNGNKHNLSQFEIPKSIEFVNSIMMTPADKIDYKYYEVLAEEEYNNEKAKIKKKTYKM